MMRPVSTIKSLMFVFLFILLIASVSASSFVLEQSQTDTDIDRSVGDGVSQTKVARTFTADSDFDLSRIDLFVKRFDNGTGDFYIELFTVNASGLPETLLANSTNTYNASLMPSEYIWVDFYLNESISIVDGTQYAISVAGIVTDSNHGIYVAGYNNPSEVRSRFTGAMSWVDTTDEEHTVRLYSENTKPIFYFDTYSYTNTSYLDCLAVPGNDEYDCYNNDTYSDWESQGYPVVQAGLQSTGLLETSLDTGRDQNDNVDYMRKEFGGSNTETIIQEDADSYNIVPNYLYINYTKPAGADRNQTEWRFKHGHNGTDVLDEYLTIPESCWDLNGPDGDIELRAYSSGYDVFENETSYGQCYNGTSWQTISSDITGSANYASYYTDDGASRLIDGNYTWGVNWRDDIGIWYWAGNSYSKIHEESMHWYVEGINPDIYFWMDESETVEYVENYYVHFWEYDVFDNITTNLDSISLFNWNGTFSTYDDTSLTSSNLNATGDTITFDSDNIASLKYGFKNITNHIDIAANFANDVGLVLNGSGANILFDKYRAGFVLFNLPDNTTLNNTDSDGDGLNDYDELYTYYTNPYQSDTDEGGRSDYLEVQDGTNPNRFEDDKIIATQLYVTPTDVYPGEELSCNFEVTNNNPYSQLDVTVSWRTSYDIDGFSVIDYNASYLDTTYTTGQIDNGTASYKLVDAPTELMFSDAGCSQSGSRHSSVACSKTIPITTDLQIVEYVVGDISSYSCGSRDGYVRFNYVDTSTYQAPNQGVGTRTFINPSPEKEVASVYVYARNTNGCDQDSPYARFQNVKFYGPLAADGPDQDLNINVITHSFDSPIDRFYVDGDIDGGSSKLYYTVDDINFIEKNTVMYQEYETCDSFGCAIDSSRLSNDNIETNEVYQTPNVFGEYSYNFTGNTSFVKLDDFYSGNAFVYEPYIENMRLLNGGTICSYIEPHNLSNVTYLVDKSNGINGTNGYSFKIETDGSLSFHVNNGGASTSNQILNVSDKAFVCVAFDDTGRNFYSDSIDITLNGTQTTLPQNTTHDVVIGNDYTLTNGANATFDSTIVFDKKLTSAEIVEVFDAMESNTLNIYSRFEEIKYHEVVAVEETDTLELLQTFGGSDGKVNDMSLKYHIMTDFINNSAYDYTFTNVNQNQLYNTSAGTGSYTGTINKNEQYICEITVTNQYQETVEESFKQAYYPIYNLSVYSPENETASDEKLIAEFSVEDYQGDIACFMQHNNMVVGSLPYSLTGEIVSSGTQSVFHYDITQLDMTAGCNGEVSLAPNTDYDLTICLQDSTGTDVPGSCNVYTSGEYGVGDTLNTNSINNTYLSNGEEYRIELTWNRIGYVSMANPLLDGNYDHGGYAKGNTNHLCVSHWTVTNNICTDDVDDFKYATSQAACEISDFNTLIENDRKYYASTTCNNPSLITNNVDFNYYADSVEQRVYEGYYRTGGTAASMSCTQANSAIDVFDCGTCLTEGNGGMSSEIWIPTSCSDGIEDDIPTGLCSNIENVTDHSDYFTYTVLGDADNIRFTQEVSANGNITWSSTSDENSWPVTEGTYEWSVMCNTTTPIENLTSDIYTYYYDLTAPSIINYNSDETVFTPEIGDNILFTADVSDSFGVDYCELVVDDLNGWEIVDTDTIDATSGSTTLDFNVRPYSVRDAVVNPDYFRTGETVWTKLSMNDGETLIVTISDNDNIYELYDANPDNVFEFYEGFEGTELNTSVWKSVSIDSATVDVSSGVLTFTDDDSDNSDYYETIEKFSQPSIVEWSGRDDTTEEWPLEVGFGHGTSNTIGKIKDRTTEDFYLFKSYSNGVPEESGVYAAIDAYENFRVVWEENNSQLYRDDILLENVSQSPYVDSGVAFGDLTAGGADDSDTKGMLDWIFVRKYSDNMPDIMCTDNVCIIEANNGDFEGLQIPLTTTYLAGDIGLSYVKDNTQVDWKIGCYDSSGTYAETPSQYFTVKDNTNPQIELGVNNAFDDTNTSVISSALTDLNLEIDYFDYNLFQAYEKITCEDSGIIYEWEDIDVELFNYNVVSDRVNNASKAFDVYDDTYANVLVGTTNGSGYIGQEFDSFYDVTSLDYKINTTDSNVKIQTYDGSTWNTLYEHARATTQHDNTLIVDNTIKGIRYLFDDTTTVEDTEQKVFFMKYIYNSGLANNGANFEHKSIVDLEGLPMQKCQFFASASDDHTEELIPDYIVTNIVNGLEYNTEHGVVANIIYDGSSSTLESVETTKQSDRYVFEFDFTEYNTEHTFIVSSMNGHPIYPRGNSKYPGHLVIWNPETRAGNWIDFNELGDAFKDYIIERIDNYNYKITVKTDVPVNSLEFQSIGGTNIFNQTWEFYIGGALNITGNNIYDSSVFGNYTYNLSTISSVPGKTEVLNVANNQTYVSGLSEGTYEITFTHPLFFDKTYVINMTQQYQNNTALTASDTLFDNTSLWNNSGNLFDNNASSWTETNSSIYTYVYMNYTAPLDTLSAVWVIDAFDESEAVIDITHNDTVQLRLKVRNGTDTDDIVPQEYVSGVWSDLDYGSLTYTGQIKEERVEWLEEASHLIDLGYDTYQAAISFNVTDVKSHEYLDDLNITLRNQDTGQNDTIVYAEDEFVKTFYVNANVEYNVDAQKPPYIRNIEPMTFDYKEEEMYTIEMPYYSTLNIIDEKTLLPFDFADPASVEFLVFCPERTESYFLDNSTIDVPINCDYDKFKFILTYAGGTGYYRSMLVDHEDSFNQTVYLIDITDTAYVYTAFIVDDLLSRYENPSIWVKKAISEDVVVIQSDFTDIEDKVGTYLIENAEYIIEVHSDNNPIEVIGSYGADVGEDKIISMYDINLDSDPNGFYQSVSYTMRVVNQSNQTGVMFSYFDAENKTDDVQFILYADRYNGTVIYTSDLYENMQSVGSLFVPLNGYENTTIAAEIILNHEEEGEKSISRLMNKEWRVPLPLQEHVSQNFLNWFFVILLSVVAIMSSKGTSIPTLAITGVALLIVLFGWFEVSISVLAIAVLFGIIEAVKGRGRG
jgi:hypothetical protein